MLKKILTKIQKVEQQKQLKLLKLAEKQKEIDDLDMTLKKLYALKREYEKLENKSVECLNSFKNKQRRNL